MLFLKYSYYIYAHFIKYLFLIQLYTYLCRRQVKLLYIELAGIVIYSQILLTMSFQSLEPTHRKRL